MNTTQDLSIHIEALNSQDETGQSRYFNDIINRDLDDTAIAWILEAFPAEQRVRLWRYLPMDRHIDVLTEMRADVRYSIISVLGDAELKLILSKLDNLSLLEWEDSLPEEIFSNALRLISRDELELYDQANVYSDDQLGHWAERKVYTLPFSITVNKAKLLLNKYQGEQPEYIYLINKNKKFMGLISFYHLIVAEDNQRLKSLIKQDVHPLNAEQSFSDAIDTLEHAEWPVVPIVNDSGQLIGEVNWQFALGVQREIYEARLLAGTGIDEGDDLFSPITKSAKKRALWLGINLLTAIMASLTIGLFEPVIAKVVALAVLMPIVASMGGIAGSQTLTLMVRATALNQITVSNRLTFLKNELGIGAINGVIWAVIIGAIAGLWYQQPLLGMTIALAIVVNIFTAALFGVFTPIVLDKFRLDPALAGSVVLTTITDVVGFFAFLGTASLLML